MESLVAAQTRFDTAKEEDAALLTSASIQKANSVAVKLTNCASSFLHIETIKVELLDHDVLAARLAVFVQQIQLPFSRYRLSAICCELIVLTLSWILQFCRAKKSLVHHSWEHNLLTCLTCEPDYLVQASVTSTLH